MCAAGEARNERTPSDQTGSGRSAPITLEVKGDTTLKPRSFTKDDLLAIDRELRAGPFEEVEWSVTDEQGTHKSTDLLAILDGVLWESVTKFEVRGSRLQYEHGLPDISLPWDHVWVRAWIGVDVSWSSTPERRQPVEFIYKKVVRLLENLPTERGSQCAFVTESALGARREQEAQGEEQAPTEQAKRGRPWWDPRRQPRSIYDWLLITVIGGIAVGVILALVFLAL